MNRKVRTLFDKLAKDLGIRVCRHASVGGIVTTITNARDFDHGLFRWEIVGLRLSEI